MNQVKKHLPKITSMSTVDIGVILDIANHAHEDEDFSFDDFDLQRSNVCGIGWVGFPKITMLLDYAKDPIPLFGSIVHEYCHVLQIRKLSLEKFEEINKRYGYMSTDVYKPGKTEVDGERYAWNPLEMEANATAHAFELFLELCLRNGPVDLRQEIKSYQPKHGVEKFWSTNSHVWNLYMKHMQKAIVDLISVKKTKDISQALKMCE